MNAAMEAQLVAIDTMLEAARTSFEAQLNAARQQLNAASTLLDGQIEAAKTQVAAALEQLHVDDEPACKHSSRTNHGTIGADDWRCDDCRARVSPPEEED